MPSRQQILGSQAMFSPSADAQSTSVHVDPVTCNSISLFKELMREYRKVDDNVTMRLNRTVAQFRDRDRHATVARKPEEEACAFFWKDLVSNWKKRTEIIQYCVAVVDQSIEDKQKTIETRELDADVEAQLKKASYAEAVRRNQMHNELTVESIIRQRSLDAFTSRCKFFEPPRSDVEAREWWDKASKGH